MEFNNIGYFQLDNLLRNRIPLALVLLDEVDLTPWYNSLVRMHLENITLTCAPEKVLESLHTKKLPTSFGVIVLDKNGQKSPPVAAELEKAGFTNVYYVKDGFVGISAERDQEN